MTGFVAVTGPLATAEFAADFARKVAEARRTTEPVPAIVEPNGRLVCERDRFGIHPLYFARIGESVVVTDTLPPLIELVPRTLDRDVLADVVLFGINAQAERTIYASIARVPPAHRLIVDRGSVTLERYWSLPIPDAPLRIDAHEAIEELRRLLIASTQRAASQRRVVVSMSGGVDSTSVAAALVHGGATQVRALTSVYDSVIPDVERGWSAKAARALGIAQDFQVCDDYRPFARWDEPAVRGYEPRTEPLSAAFIDFLGIAARAGDVLITGQGGDPALYTSHSYFFDLLRHFRFGRFLVDALGYAITRRRRPPLLLRSRLFRKRPEPVPEWLRVPWRDFPPVNDDRVHPWRPEAFRSLSMTIWPAVFESFDAGVTHQPIDYAVPYFDGDLLTFLFALPPMPHFADKDLVRRAMRGWLPDGVRLRPKTPLPGDPAVVRFGEERDRWIAAVRDADQLDELVNRRSLCTDLVRNGVDPALRRQQLAVVALALWLQHRQ